MALIIEDRVMETTTTTGTGALTLAGAVTGFKAFSAVCSVGDTAYYTIEGVDVNGVPTGEWETGLGTYSAANTLTRTTVSRSSNSNAAVSFSAGTKRVAISAIAASLASGWVLISSVTPSGAAANFINLGSYTELMIVAKDVTSTGSGFRFVQASFDNGTTYLSTSGDYKSFAVSGTPANQGDMGGHSSSLTTASLFVHVKNNLAGSIKIYTTANQGNGFIANATGIANAITALTLGCTSTMNGGTVAVYGKK